MNVKKHFFYLFDLKIIRFVLQNLGQNGACFNFNLLINDQDLFFSVVYQTFGQFVRVDDDGSLVLPTILPPIHGNNKHNNSSSNGFSMDSFNLFGKAIQNRTAMVSTPEKDRRHKREKLTELEKKHLPDADIILDWDLVDVDHLHVDKVPDGVLNEFPAWEYQISGV